MALAQPHSKYRLEILAFHRVLDDSCSYFIPPMVLARKIFVRLLHQLSRRFKVLPLEEALDLLKSGTLNSNLLALTFDDGYLDNYYLAENFLFREGFPATFFIPINQVNREQPFWWDYAKYAADIYKQQFWDWVESPHFLNPDRFPITQVCAPSNRPIRSIRALIQNLNSLSFKDRNILLTALKETFGPYKGPQLLMTWDNIVTLKSKGFCIGSHTMSHEPLTDLDEIAARSEIFESRTVLQRKLDGAIQGFCYPRGAFSPQIARWVKEAGYTYAVTTRYGTNISVHDKYALCRRNIADYLDFRSLFPVFALRMEMTGLFDNLLTARRS